LAAILATDVVGFSRLMGRDEHGTLTRLKAHRIERLEPTLTRNGGRLVKLTGDGALVEFPSAVGALNTAIEFQQAMAEANRGHAEDISLVFRIGLHLGDLIVEGDDLYGDGVNIAARLEAEAPPGGIIVSRAVCDAVEGRLKARLHPLGELALKNMERPIQAFRVEWEAADWPIPAASAAAALPAPTYGPLALPDEPSIVILPFANLSDDPEQAFFADGVTEDLTTALSRLRWLFVVARNSAYAYKDRGVDVRIVARELGVRYALEGSVRRVGPRIRITAQLIDAEKGGHIWAERYDRQLDDIFAVQDEITGNIVASIEPHLWEREGDRAAAKPPDSVDVWGLVVRAIDLVNRFGLAENEEARRLLERAITLDPAYARAHAIFAWALWWATLYYYIADRDAGYAASSRHAQEALRLDRNEPWARLMAGLNLSTAGQHERALAELATALALNPNFALGRTLHGWALLRAGRYDEAVAETARALRMSPLDSFAGLYTTTHGLALLAAHRFEEALPHLRASVAADAEFAGHYNALISCCGHLGLLDEAAHWLARRDRIGPPLRVKVLRHNLRNFAHREVFAEGLIKARVPE
jgi:adenylate cyclase